MQDSPEDLLRIGQLVSTDSAIRILQLVRGQGLNAARLSRQHVPESRRAFWVPTKVQRQGRQGSGTCKIDPRRLVGRHEQGLERCELHNAHLAVEELSRKKGEGSCVIAASQHLRTS